MERRGNLRVLEELRRKLMAVSAATVDRILQPERWRQYLGSSQTKKATLLKKSTGANTY